MVKALIFVYLYKVLSFNVDLGVDSFLKIHPNEIKGFALICGEIFLSLNHVPRSWGNYFVNHVFYISASEPLESRYLVSYCDEQMRNKVIGDNPSIQPRIHANNWG